MKTTSVEAFSIPLQQIARVIALDKNITAKDEKYLKKIFLSGIETTLKATNDKELENRIKNFSNF